MRFYCRSCHVMQSSNEAPFTFEARHPCGHDIVDVDKPLDRTGPKGRCLEAGKSHAWVEESCDRVLIRGRWVRRTRYRCANGCGLRKMGHCPTGEKSAASVREIAKAIGR